MRFFNEYKTLLAEHLRTDIKFREMVYEINYVLFVLVAFLVYGVGSAYVKLIEGVIQKELGVAGGVLVFAILLLATVFTFVAVKFLLIHIKVFRDECVTVKSTEDEDE